MDKPGQETEGYHEGRQDLQEHDSLRITTRIAKGGDVYKNRCNKETGNTWKSFKGRTNQNELLNTERRQT